jgi:superfamily II DNA or RNA helicase
MSATVHNTSKSGRKKRRREAKSPKLSRVIQPADLSLVNWQIELRRQFGREQRYKLTNLESEAVFSTFEVLNPQSKGRYRVTIRGSRPGDNFCTCPDFVTNSLGTCKHVEFVLSRLARKPGAKTALRQGFTPEYSQVLLRYGARREVVFKAGAQCPPELAKLAQKYFGADGGLSADAFPRFEKFLSESARLETDLRCGDDVLAFVAEVRDRETRAKTIDDAFPNGIRSKSFDSLLKVNLYDYQRQGALFALRAGRCLIGDDMGLGKTVQAIAAAEIMARHLGVARVLVICPTSLKHQWEREISRFTDRSAEVIGGLRARRQEGFGTDTFFKITNYDTVHVDLDLIDEWSPDLVILDEAQRIKNWNTRAARSVKKIQSTFAIVLTGTPLENRLEELVSIVQKVDQHRLGPTFRFLADHQKRDPETGRVIGYQNLDTIGTTLAPMLLRRRKAQVLAELPGRIEKNFFVRMTPEQLKHHNENRDIVAKIVHKWRAHGFLSEADQRRLMIALQNMRMSCNSTYLLDQETDFGTKADELAMLLEELCEEPDRKVVVFSQWVRTHELIERRLKKLKLGHVMFNGRVPGAARKSLIDRFRDEPGCRAFLSTDAGGVGLNLQHASAVVNMDLPWNPAVLEQRIGRVHRLGQTRPVQVFNFIAQGTIEEGMLDVIKFKRSMFAGVLDGGEKEVFLGGSRLKKFIDTVDQATRKIPAAVAEEILEPEAPARAGAALQDSGADVPTTIVSASAPVDLPGSVPAWAGLLQTGLSLLTELASAARGESSSNGSKVSGSVQSLVHRDPQSGQPYLRLPVPGPGAVEKLLTSLTEFLRGLTK